MEAVVIEAACVWRKPLCGGSLYVAAVFMWRQSLCGGSLHLEAVVMAKLFHGVNAYGVTPRL